jgi:hypothetical protein
MNTADNESQDPLELTRGLLDRTAVLRQVSSTCWANR